jgi:hypothetical protein
MHPSSILLLFGLFLAAHLDSSAVGQVAAILALMVLRDR